MDKVILTDKTEFEILENSSLSNIKINVKSTGDIKQVVHAFQDENLKSVTFTHEGKTTAEYSDMKYDTCFCAPHTGTDGTEDGTYDVSISIRSKTEIEKAIEELKAEHELNAGAIQDLADMVAGSGE